MTVASSGKNYNDYVYLTFTPIEFWSRTNGNRQPGNGSNNRNSGYRPTGDQSDPINQVAAGNRIVRDRGTVGRLLIRGLFENLSAQLGTFCAVEKARRAVENTFSTGNNRSLFAEHLLFASEEQND